MQGLQKHDKTQNKKNCTCLYSNVDALTNKKEELAALIAIHAPMIIALTETMSKHQTYSLKEFVIENYDLFSNENPRRGTFIYTHKDLKATGVTILNNNPYNECVVHHQSNAQSHPVSGLYLPKPKFNPGEQHQTKQPHLPS